MEYYGVSLLPHDHSARLDWLTANCPSFFEHEYISSHWGLGKIIYKFNKEQDVTLFLLKWK